MLLGLSILAARNQFYPRPLRQSGKQGTVGSCNRCIGASRDPSSIQGSINASVHLQLRAAPQGLFLPAGSRLSLTTSLVPGDCLWLLSCRAHFQPLRACPADFKGGVTTLKVRPCSGALVCAGPVLNGEHSALPLTRHCQVDWGSCPVAVSHKRTCQLRLPGGQKH
jgi:hypothetical protein